ncbi:MAG: hypothetical protein V7L11_11725 [Nostoc sp.]|uniref:hypothetical protein n=1 Tax=Nostoc sp. TaxID=1180 RepID=UPI002FF5ACDA
MKTTVKREIQMKYRQLGNSELSVSEISLGSWLTYGGGVEQQNAEACIHKALELPVRPFFRELEERLLRSKRLTTKLSINSSREPK